MPRKFLFELTVIIVGVILNFNLYANGDSLKLRTDGVNMNKVCGFWKNLDMKSDQAKRLIEESTDQSIYSEFDLETLKGHSLEEILYILSLTERGRKFLAELLPLYDEGDLEFIDMQSDKANTLTDKRPGGLYREGKMFVDYENPMGYILPNFFHNGILALDFINTPFDTELPKLEGYCSDLRTTPKTDSNWQELAEKIVTITFKVLNAQVKAYKATDVLISELIEISPEFKQALFIMIDNGAWVYPMTEDAFRDVMINEKGFGKTTVDSYLERNPW